MKQRMGGVGAVKGPILRRQLHTLKEEKKDVIERVLPTRSVRVY